MLSQQHSTQARRIIADCDRICAAGLANTMHISHHAAEQLIDRLAADGIIAEHSHGSYTVLEHTP